MQIKIVSFFLFLLSFHLSFSQEKKEYDAIFEKQLLNVQYPGEQYINSGEYLLSVANTNIQKAQAYFLISQGYNQLGDIEKSIQNLFSAKKLSNLENNTFLSCYAEIMSSRFCFNLGLYDKAKSYLADAKNKTESIEDTKQKTIVLSLVLEEQARELILNGKIQAAIDLLKKEEALCLGKKMPEIFLTGNRNLTGYCYLRTSQIDFAEHYFTRCLSTLSKNNITSSCSKKYAQSND